MRGIQQMNEKIQAARHLFSQFKLQYLNSINFEDSSVNWAEIERIFVQVVANALSVTNKENIINE
jgi:hypothetical protein